MVTKLLRPTTQELDALAEITQLTDKLNHLKSPMNRILTFARIEQLRKQIDKNIIDVFAV